MTAAVLVRSAVAAPRPPCPAWCTNDRHPLAAMQDMCDAGGGTRDHLGRIGGVVLPSRVDDYYDEEIGVELYRYDLADGTTHQLSVLLTYSTEHGEIGHVTLDIEEAKRLVAFTRGDGGLGAGRKFQQQRFAGLGDNNILADRPCGLSSAFVMTVEGRRKRMALHRSQLECLGDIVASACVLAGVAR